jgi:hypothetical protein
MYIYLGLCKQLWFSYSCEIWVYDGAEDVVRVVGCYAL